MDDVFKSYLIERPLYKEVSNYLNTKNFESIKCTGWCKYNSATKQAYQVAIHHHFYIE